MFYVSVVRRRAIAAYSQHRVIASLLWALPRHCAACPVLFASCLLLLPVPLGSHAVSWSRQCFVCCCAMIAVAFATRCPMVADLQPSRASCRCFLYCSFSSRRNFSSWARVDYCFLVAFHPGLLNRVQMGGRGLERLDWLDPACESRFYPPDGW